MVYLIFNEFSPTIKSAIFQKKSFCDFVIDKTGSLHFNPTNVIDLFKKNSQIYGIDSTEFHKLKRFLNFHYLNDNSLWSTDCLCSQVHNTQKSVCVI